MLVRKVSFVPMEAKIQLFKSYWYPFMGVLFDVIHTNTLLENLLSVIMIIIIIIIIIIFHDIFPPSRRGSHVK